MIVAGWTQSEIDSLQAHFEFLLPESCVNFLARYGSGWSHRLDVELCFPSAEDVIDLNLRFASLFGSDRYQDNRVFAFSSYDEEQFLFILLGDGMGEVYRYASWDGSVSKIGQDITVFLQDIIATCFA